jgi:protein-tyrosine phosphatase
MQTYTDIHCHMLFGIDDGSKSAEESLAMARMAVDDGIRTVILTPHQLGAFRRNSGNQIRRRAGEFQHLLKEHDIDLQVLPGGDVRIEPDMVALLQSGEVLTLGDHGRHVLLELPHELYFPLEPVLDELASIGMTGILSHPERNMGLMREPELLEPLVERGCLMQVTAGSLMGTFGQASQEMSEWMLSEGLVHFLATDAHGMRARRPLLDRAFERVAELIDEPTAVAVCCENPAAVAQGRDVSMEPVEAPANRGWGWFGRRSR